MPARGRHRRYQPHRVSRASLTVTASGAGIALPLIGAAPADAATQEAWEKVADCESSGDWNINTGNGFYGGLQFTEATWQEYGGTAYAERADLATKGQQIAVAEGVLRGQGPTAWPTCATGSTLVLNTDGTTPPPDSSTPRVARTSAPTAGDRPSAAEPSGARPQDGAATERYTVVSGDTLFGISERKGVDGGWQGLYARNQDTVGADPDLILPGQRLRLDGPVPSTRVTEEPAEKPAQPSAQKPERKPAQKPAEKPAQKAAEKPTTRSSPKPEAKPDQKPDAKTDAKPDQKPDRKPDPKPEQKSDQKPQRKPAEQRADSSRTRDAQRSRPQQRPATPAPRFTAPVSATPSTSYRSPGSMWSRGYHTGVDFPVGTGTSVKVVGSGKVVSAGWAGSYGYQVVVRHPDGKYSQYAHLSSISVRAGQPVNAGQRLGRSGSTGNSTGPHLHFEIRTGPDFGSDVDPLAYLRSHGVRI